MTFIGCIRTLSARNLLAVIFDDESGEREKSLRELVRCERVDVDPCDVGDVTDWELIAKAHKEKTVTDRAALNSLLISRTAAKELVL